MKSVQRLKNWLLAERKVFKFYFFLFLANVTPIHRLGPDEHVRRYAEDCMSEREPSVCRCAHVYGPTRFRTTASDPVLLGRDKDYIDLMVNYTGKVGLSAAAISMVPSFLKPYVPEWQFR